MREWYKNPYSRVFLKQTQVKIFFQLPYRAEKLRNSRPEVLYRRSVLSIQRSFPFKNSILSVLKILQVFKIKHYEKKFFFVDSCFEVKLKKTLFSFLLTTKGLIFSMNNSQTTRNLTERNSHFLLSFFRIKNLAFITPPFCFGCFFLETIHLQQYNFVMHTFCSGLQGFMEKEFCALNMKLQC